MAEAYPADAAPLLVDSGPSTSSPTSTASNSTPPFVSHSPPSISWTPMLHQACTFPPSIFQHVMLNFIKNPNNNTSWLVRADVTLDQTTGPFKLAHDHDAQKAADVKISNSVLLGSPRPTGRPAINHIPCFPGYKLSRMMVRTLVPRNTLRDAPLDQTCLWYTKHDPDGVIWSLIVYIPHGEKHDLPFYHPKVRGVAHLHHWTPEKASSDSDSESTSGSGSGSVSVHFLFFDPVDRTDTKLARTALHLLSVLHKHGKGQAAGYKKRVHHDLVISQPRFQDRYALLKIKYASTLVSGWAERTDPSKHVFEDLGIAAFLIELWADMYDTTKQMGVEKPKREEVADMGIDSHKEDKPPFPGFVDIGCGNGLLVHILRQEGYHGWGFDARDRRSWDTYKAPPPQPGQEEPLQAKVLLPALASPTLPDLSSTSGSSSPTTPLLHDGVFPAGTFIISNHADELTPWTPLLAAYSSCPFLMIPCCSHNLSGAKFRALPPRDKTKPHSAYASLVDWVAQIAEACGYHIETEMLRIPSTRNTALLGRVRTMPWDQVDLNQVVDRFGGCAGYLESVMQLVKGGPRGH
ncbi:tRNA (uracil-O(2)-)-methyltransferase [Ceratocystis lukuohia]|uniref:tRNA (uracil-O(2)-)-methyltransferase n=1 Tax=Ceratocystis lukuohia TaxID=2019550 RepID=A0ABR4M9B4_9PEZI